MIIWTIGHLFISVLACLSSQALTCLHWLVWFISCTQIRFRSCIAVFFPRWRAVKHRKRRKHKCGNGVGTLRGHARSSRRTIVFPAVCIAGARRRLAKFVKRKFPTHGIRIMHLYCMQHAAFTLARPEKQKTIRNRRQKQQRRHMRKHTARAEAKHRNLVSTEATQDTTHCTRLYSKIPNPRLCGGGRGGAKMTKHTVAQTLIYSLDSNSFFKPSRLQNSHKETAQVMPVCSRHLSH